MDATVMTFAESTFQLGAAGMVLIEPIFFPQQLGQVRCPVLIIEGGESENRQHIDLEKAGTAFQNARHRLIRKAGHLVPMEQPEEALLLLSEFMETIRHL
jgi:pimeloyl-ACP methyl ester carboxylesterase